MTGPLEAIAATLDAEGGLVAAAVGPPPVGTPTPHGDVAAAGPGRAPEYAQIVEAVREGHLTHAAEWTDNPVRPQPRIVTTDDPDLALLVGDRLYALGLARLAELGDLDAVAVLADTIVLGAQAHATGAEDLAEAAWAAGAQAVAQGPREAWTQARDSARAGDPSGASALRDAARQLARTGANAP
ncbi:hypothetical protein DSM112329_05440 [Paraconexibacter sp. AEG42_29]|uniref:Uncharacterized protein n=1 Tax=Paraconexibacter sp. AEG42_29 TaxID=2997339 RepID=A0AAU7B4D5_9ACTN